MIRFIAFISAAIGIVLVLLALFGYMGLREMATSPTGAILNDNFLLRMLTTEFVKNSPPNIDAAQLYRWLSNRVMGRPAFAIALHFFGRPFHHFVTQPYFVALPITRHCWIKLRFASLNFQP